MPRHAIGYGISSRAVRTPSKRSSCGLFRSIKTLPAPRRDTIKHKMSKLISAFILGVLCGSVLPAQTQTADLILVNGKIITVDASDSIAQAVAISSGKIIAVGSNDTAR